MSDKKFKSTRVTIKKMKTLYKQGDKAKVDEILLKKEGNYVKTAPVKRYSANKLPKAIPRDLWKRLFEDLDFDPLAMSVAVAKGEMLTQDHPFLGVILKGLNNLKGDLKDKGMDVGLIEQLMTKAAEMLTDSWTPIELRSKHILELMNYIYPKKKAVDMTHGGQIDFDLAYRPLTLQEIKEFKKYFDDKF